MSSDLPVVGPGSCAQAAVCAFAGWETTLDRFRLGLGLILCPPQCCVVA